MVDDKPVQGPWFDADRLNVDSCDVALQAEQFTARGSGAMSTQTTVLSDYHRAITTRTIAAYTTSVAFAGISAALIVFAPESRATAANLVAGAFLVLAVGIAGFTRFKAKAPAIQIEADRN